jgi:hypothetical protein
MWKDRECKHNLIKWRIHLTEKLALLVNENTYITPYNLMKILRAHRHATA